MFKVGEYLNQDTGRTRWAVLDTVSRCWYFPPRHGRKAAEQMAARLNRGV